MTADPIAAITSDVPTAEAAAYDKFRADTRGHVMSILHCDGHYRHLRFRTPGSGLCSLR